MVLHTYVSNRLSPFSHVCRPIAGVVNLCPYLAEEEDIGNIVLTVTHELTHALVSVCMCALQGIGVSLREPAARLADSVW